MNAWPKAVVLIAGMVIVAAMTLELAPYDPGHQATVAVLAGLAAAVGFGLRHFFGGNRPKPP